MKKNVLCLSRSYLARLLPTLGQHHPEANYFHIVQTDKEAALVTSLGGTVVLNIQSIIRQGLSEPNCPQWEEPADLRAVTSFMWSPLYSDRYLSHFSKEQRLKIAGVLDREIKKLFEIQTFDGFLSEPVALFITHILFYYSRKNNVRPLLWCNTYFSGYFYFADGPEISQPIRKTPIDDEAIVNLEKTIQDYAHGIVADSTGPIYHHAFSGVKKNRWSYFKQRKGESPLVLNAGVISRLIQFARLARATLARLLFPVASDFMTAGAVSEHIFYLKCLFAPTSAYDTFPAEFSKDNAVYPLQYEPEASLLYFAPHIVNQLSFVESILRALPEGKVLWIKEHPNQFGALGNKQWLALKKRYHNVRFVHGRQNGRELIKRSALVVSISSTMGLDALLLGRTTLVAGSVFYNNYNGSIRISSYKELAVELNKISNYESRFNVDANIVNLLELGKKSYLGDPQPSNFLYSEKNINDLVKAIDAELTAEENIKTECVEYDGTQV
tara:strand:- start:18648 stop:20141 length:1494 start_codon:yes stop_codon:yes gene_type:complete